SRHRCHPAPRPQGSGVAGRGLAVGRNPISCALASARQQRGILMATDRSGAAGTPASPPAEITAAAYRAWLTAIGSSISAFFDPVFAWHDEQRGCPLPPEVSDDRDHLVIDVRQALDETIELERAGRIESGNTFGFEAYGLVDVPVSVALEAALF